MASGFNVRRDNSTNNVPTVGYNEGVDAQDVILFGTRKVTETAETDGTGTIKLTHYPVSVLGAVQVDVDGTRRARNYNDDITIVSTDGTVGYYAGAVSPTDKTLKVYMDASRATVTVGTKVKVTYYKRVPIKIDDSGSLVLTERTKGSIMLKKEGLIGAGASANEMTWAIGNSAKGGYVTNVMAYYNGTDTETDPRVGCWFDIMDASGTSVGTMDLTIPAKASGMLQLDFGPVGLHIPVGGKFRFRVGSTWTENTVHVLATGWQYTD